MSSALHEPLEVTLSCIHIDIWVEEGLEHMLCSRKDMCDIAISNIVIPNLLAVLLLK